jgi:NDP-sugar pyrophosphorylase family protein
MLAFHQQTRAKVSIALTPVETDAQGRVRRFIKKPAWEEVTSKLINGSDRRAGNFRLWF